jgi:hypothetical protein
MIHFIALKCTYLVSQPHFGLSVRVKPTLPKVGSWSPPGLPKIQSSISGSNLLAFERSWCHWKVIEVHMSEMASHWSFGHLQPKLWAKEGPGVKLAVWLPTTKSRESSRSRRALGECDTALESSWRGLQVWFRPRPDRRLGREAMMSQSPRSLKSGQFRHSTLGVPGQTTTWVWVRWSNA